jgi:hypothetical protein
MKGTVQLQLVVLLKGEVHFRAFYDLSLCADDSRSWIPASAAGIRNGACILHSYPFTYMRMCAHKLMRWSELSHWSSDRQDHLVKYNITKFTSKYYSTRDVQNSQE